jgi:hypothetical protein
MGSMFAALFGGVVGVALNIANFLGTKLYKLITGKQTQGIQREDFVEDIVGRQMMQAHFNTFSIPNQSDLYNTLSDSAKTVAREGYWNKFLMVFFRTEMIMKLWDLLGKYPMLKISGNLSVHITPLSPFRKFVESAKKTYQTSPIPDKLPDNWQWWLKWIPKGAINKANEWVGTFIEQGHEWVDQVRTIVQDIPFLGSVLHFSLGNFPLKAELFSAGLSFAYNTTTGLGTMALIDMAKRNQGSLPRNIEQELAQKKYLKTIKIYIQSIRKAIDERNHTKT